VVAAGGKERIAVVDDHALFGQRPTRVGAQLIGEIKPTVVARPRDMDEPVGVIKAPETVATREAARGDADHRRKVWVAPHVWKKKGDVRAAESSEWR